VRIINFTVDGSIGTQTARVIFGDLETSDGRAFGLGW